MARKRARTTDGHFIADDPNTPENEAWADEEAPKKKERKAPPKKKEPTPAAPQYQMFVSAEPENGAFDIRLGDDVKIKGRWDIQRAFVTWRVPNDLLDVVKMHHHVWSGRIVPFDEED